MAGSQKGLMLPPGLSFNAISAKALDASRAAKLPKLYWSWGEMLSSNRSGFFPYTPSTNLLYGLREAIEMLVHEEVWKTLSGGTPGTRKRLDRPYAPGVSSWSAWILANTVTRLPPCFCQTVTPRFSCAKSSWNTLTCLLARVLAN